MAHVGVHGHELDALNAQLGHAVEGVAARAARADHVDAGLGLLQEFEQLLVVFGDDDFLGQLVFQRLVFKRHAHAPQKI